MRYTTYYYFQDPTSVTFRPLTDPQKVINVIKRYKKGAERKLIILALELKSCSININNFF